MRTMWLALSLLMLGLGTFGTYYGVALGHATPSTPSGTMRALDGYEPPPPPH